MLIMVAFYKETEGSFGLWDAVRLACREAVEE